jgi:predicted transcriptional regulator
MENKTFIFKYDPKSSMEGLFEDLQQVWQGKLKRVEPNIIRSNSIKALLHGLTEERRELFSVLAKKKPISLIELAKYLNRDYKEVKKDSEILASWGIIELQSEKLIALYDKIVFSFCFQEPSLKDLKIESRALGYLLENRREISFLETRDVSF